MHAIIGKAQMNRKGRKRKSGRRTASGELARVRVDYQTMAANNPDRRTLPAALRLSEKAGSVLGRLNLIKRISDEMYEAGRRYSVHVGAYLAMAGAPNGTAGHGGGYDCVGASDCPPDTCICRVRTENYMRAYEAISRYAGRPGHMAVNCVAIEDHDCTEEQIMHLQWGLAALADHYGLTQRGKSRQ